MNVSMFCALVAAVCLGFYLLGGVPEVWAAMLEISREDGATPEQARLSCAWKRVQLLAWAAWYAVLAVLAAMP